MKATHRDRGKNSPAAVAFVALVISLLALLAAVPASAAPPQLWQKCDSDEPVGQGCALPRGVAADPDNGHVFVGDQENRRVVDFNALGQFVKTWGWDVVETGPGNDTSAPEGEFEVCVPRQGDVCKAGVLGNGPGQFTHAIGLAVDSIGSIYVTDFDNNRVQKFDRKGNFVLMFGGEVNKTKVESGTASEEEENLCPIDPGDECQAGAQGAGKGQFGAWAVGDVIEVDAADKLYVGDENRIQRFSTEGVYQEECAVPGTVQSLDTDAAGTLFVAYEHQLDVRKLTPTPGCAELMRFELPKAEGFYLPLPHAVAVDRAGNVYAFGEIFCCGSTGLDPIIKFDPAGNVVEEFGKGEFKISTGLATNLCEGSEAPGNLYVTNAFGSGHFVRAYGTEPIGCFRTRTLPADPIAETSATFNGTVNPRGEALSACFFEYGTSEAYGQTVPCAESSGEIGIGTEPVPVHADLSGLDPSTVYHFRLAVEVGGELETGADEAFKTLGPPAISEEHAVSVTYTEATVAALVNPEDFPTSCRVEYGLDSTYGQSTPSFAVGSDRGDRATSTVVEDLTPGTTYHWRFVCTNTALLNGGVAGGEDRTLTTYRPVGAPDPCPNDESRGGSSADLPDCRAYEMVSPLDKNGADIVRGLSSADDPGGYVQASLDGEKLTYTSKFPTFGENQENSALFNQYLATRHEGVGWFSEGIHPPFEGEGLGIVGLFREFMAFSPDLCDAWLVDIQTPPVTPAGQEGYHNLYRRHNCDPGKRDLEALTTAPPPPGTLTNYVAQYSMQGVSEDSRHALFIANAPLTADAAAGIKPQIYDRFGGDLALVSVLPGGEPNPTGAVVGSDWHGNLANAVSRDGSLVYWTAEPAGASASGKIYLRHHPEQGIVNGECTKASKACTLEVSTGKAGFQAAAADGSKALYSEGQELYEFDLARAKKSEAPRLIAADAMGVAGASEDLARIYFVSTQNLSGAQQNSEGEEAREGAPNLYLEEADVITFVATLAEGDVGEAEPGAGGVVAYDLVGPSYYRATRVTPDGSRIAFQSRASLSGFDNLDAASGKRAAEVFVYEAGGDLHCVSCNPSGARPSIREMPEPYNYIYLDQTEPRVLAAAWIPTWEQPLYASNVLSSDGTRLFFNSNDALLPRDNNGAQDVYEWEAPGTGSCDTEDADYFAENGGCLYLISTGKNSFEAEFWEASRDGRDVFFTTESGLWPEDPGSLDLYDARAGGGFALPAQRPICEGEACQSPPPAPNDPTPGSASFRGAGNVVEKSARRRCPKGKRKVRRRGKVRCAKKQRSGSRANKANRNRRAAR